MDTIHHPEALQERILYLQQRRDQQWNALKDSFQDQYESLKPANFLRHAVQGITENIDLKPGMLQAGVSLAAGMMVKTVMGRTKNKPLKKWMKVLLIYAITAFVARYREEILDVGEKLVQGIKGMLQKENQETGEIASDLDIHGVEGV